MVTSSADYLDPPVHRTHGNCRLTWSREWLSWKLLCWKRWAHGLWKTYSVPENRRQRPSWRRRAMGLCDTRIKPSVQSTSSQYLLRQLPLACRISLEQNGFASAWNQQVGHGQAVLSTLFQRPIHLGWWISRPILALYHPRLDYFVGNRYILIQELGY